MYDSLNVNLSGPIPKLNWAPMLMTFKANPEIDLNNFKEGDKVEASFTTSVSYETLLAHLKVCTEFWCPIRVVCTNVSLYSFPEIYQGQSYPQA